MISRQPPLGYNGAIAPSGPTLRPRGVPDAPAAPARRRVIVAASDLPGSASAADPRRGWVDLSQLSAWNGQAQGWSTVGDARLDVQDPKRLARRAGTGVICNGPAGGSPTSSPTRSSATSQVQFDFFLPKRVELGDQVSGSLRDPALRQPRRQGAEGDRLRRGLPPIRTEAQVPPHRRRPPAAGQRRAPGRAVANPRRHLHRPAVRRRRQEDRRRPDHRDPQRPEGPGRPHG